jgi:hypothetical protein
VRLSVGGRLIATLTANPPSDVTYLISPALLHLAAGSHLVSLASMHPGHISGPEPGSPRLSRMNPVASVRSSW